MTIKISEERLKELLSAWHELMALNFGGVDNWEWGWQARHDYIDEYINEHPLFTQRFLGLEDWQPIDGIDFETIADYEISMLKELQEEENAST